MPAKDENPGRKLMSSDLSVAAQRAHEIVQELLRTGEVTVDDLARRVKISAATIRGNLPAAARRPV